MPSWDLVKECIIFFLEEIMPEIFGRGRKEGPEIHDLFLGNLAALAYGIQCNMHQRGSGASCFV